MQVIKPKRLGVIYKTYHLKYHHFSVGAMAFFPLTGEKNKKSQLLQEYEQWQRCLSQLPPTEPLDMGFVKPQGEVLMSAKAYFHQHGLLHRCRAGIEVGTSNGHGKRRISKKIRIKRSKKEQRIEQFMPIDLMDKQRSRYNGSYDKHWLENIHPGLPEDTNTRLFNCAASDQQCKKGLFKTPYFTPGAPYVLTDVHPSEKQLEGNLPDINVRIFANIHNNLLDPSSGTSFKELDTVLETVWFFPEENLGVAIYRGVTEVQDSDGLDVSHLMMAYENANDHARPLDYYQNVLNLRTQPETQLAHLFNESQLMPIKTDAETSEIAKKIKCAEDKQKQKVNEQREQYIQQALSTVKASMPEGTPGEEDVDQAFQNASSESGLATADEEVADYALPVIPEALLASGDFDLSELLASVDKMQASIASDSQQKQEELIALADNYQKDYQTESPEKEEPLEEAKQKIIHPVFVVAKDLKQQQADTGSALEKMLNEMPNDAQEAMATDDSYDPQAIADAYDKVITMQREARQASPTIVGRRILSQHSQQCIRRWVEELIQTQQLLAGRDFSCTDLSGINFSGLDLRDVMLEGCDLTGCDFSQAKMNGAALTEATINHACFDHAVLSHANLSHCKGSQTSFKHVEANDSVWMNASMNNARFDQFSAKNMIAMEADFSESIFNESTISDSHFVKAVLSSSCWHKASVTASTFLEATLQDSHWNHAHISRCIMIKLDAQRLSMPGASLDKVQFSNEGDLQYSDFSHVKCTTCGFRGVNLQALYAPHASFVECDFAEAILFKSDFSEAIFKRTVMTMAQLEGSLCHKTLFNEGIVRKVNFTECDLTSANFYQCTLTENITKKMKKHHMTVSPQASLS